MKWRIGGTSWADPQERTIEEELYGMMNRRNRCLVQQDRHVLNLLADRSYPEKLEIEAIYRARVERIEHKIALAQASRIGRTVFLPRSVIMALRRRAIWPLTEALKYLFEEFYRMYWRARYG